MDRAVKMQTRAAAAPPLTASEAEVLQFLLPLSADYPDLERWYRSKVVPDVARGSRLVLRVERDGVLLGVGIAKKHPAERKICTVRVAPSHANRGTGPRIFDALLKWLDVDQPHLTIGEHKLPLFERIFDYYGFSLSSTRRGVYVPGAFELGYNEAPDLASVGSPGCNADLLPPGVRNGSGGAPRPRIRPT